MQERRKRILLAERGQIDWFPTIDESLCVGCQICFQFCPKKVFTWDEVAVKARVTQPYECVVLCSGCVPKCPAGAIRFPKREDFEHYVRYE